MALLEYGTNIKFMNTKYLVILCLFFAILSPGACSEDRDSERMEELNATGEVFMERVKERNNWQAEWEAIEKLGTPLPNESKYGKDYYLLPVFAGKNAYYGIYYPVEGERDTCKLGEPFYWDKTYTKEELFSLSFDVGKKDWEETEPCTIVIESWE